MVSQREKRELKKNTELYWKKTNPDCGLKTRDNKETIESLKNLVEATKSIKKELNLGDIK